MLSLTKTGQKKITFLKGLVRNDIMSRVFINHSSNYSKLVLFILGLVIITSVKAKTKGDKIWIVLLCAKWKYISEILTTKIQPHHKIASKPLWFVWCRVQGMANNINTTIQQQYFLKVQKKKKHKRAPTTTQAKKLAKFFFLVK